MNDKTTIAEIIIWAFPVVAGLALWGMRELYASIKSDLKSVKESQYNTNKKLDRVDARLDVVDAKLVNQSTDLMAVKFTAHQIDQRTGNTREMVESMKHIETKLREQQTEYGKIILVLKKVIQIIRPKSNPPN